MGRQAYLDKIAFVQTPPERPAQDMANEYKRVGLRSSLRRLPQSQQNTSSSNRRNLKSPHDTTRLLRTTTFSYTMSAEIPSTRALTSMARSLEAHRMTCLRR